MIEAGKLLKNKQVIHISIVMIILKTCTLVIIKGLIKIGIELLVNLDFRKIMPLNMVEMEMLIKKEVTMVM